MSCVQDKCCLPHLCSLSGWRSGQTGTMLVLGLKTDPGYGGLSQLLQQDHNTEVCQLWWLCYIKNYSHLMVLQVMLHLSWPWSYWVPRKHPDCFHIPILWHIIAYWIADIRYPCMDSNNSQHKYVLLLLHTTWSTDDLVLSKTWMPPSSLWMCHKFQG